MLPKLVALNSLLCCHLLENFPLNVHKCTVPYTIVHVLTGNINFSNTMPSIHRLREVACPLTTFGSLMCPWSNSSFSCMVCNEFKVGRRYLLECSIIRLLVRKICAAATWKNSESMVVLQWNAQQTSARFITCSRSDPLYAQLH